MQPGSRFLVDYYAALARLIHAGQPLPRAASAASRHPAAARVAEALQAGASPEEAFQKGGFPAEDILVIGVGAATGRLDTVLQHLSSHYARLVAARRVIFSRSLYPLLVIHLAAVLLAIPPAILAGESGVFFLRAGLTLGALYGIGALLALASVIGLRLYKSSARAVQLLGKIPGLGGWLSSATGGRFAAVFALLVKAGAGPFRGMEAAGRACRNARLRQAAARAIEIGRRGEPLAIAFEGIIPSSIARALELGQVTGRLDSEMQLVSQELEAAAQARLEAVAEWLPRLFYLIIVAYVGWRIVATALETGEAIGKALDPQF